MRLVDDECEQWCRNSAAKPRTLPRKTPPPQIAGCRRWRWPARFPTTAHSQCARSIAVYCTLKSTRTFGGGRGRQKIVDALAKMGTMPGIHNVSKGTGDVFMESHFSHEMASPFVSTHTRISLDIAAPQKLWSCWFSVFSSKQPSCSCQQT